MSTTNVILLPAHIDEDTIFPKVDPSLSLVTFDLADLKMMNSSGVRTWIRWAKSIAGTAEIRLRNVPMMFLNLSSIIANIIVPSMVIESIRLDYVYDYSEETRSVFFERPSDRKPITIPHKISIEGRLFEFDGLVDRTFAQVKNQFTFVESILDSDLVKIFGKLK